MQGVQVYIKYTTTKNNTKCLKDTTYMCLQIWIQRQWIQIQVQWIWIQRQWMRILDPMTTTTDPTTTDPDPMTTVPDPFVLKDMYAQFDPEAYL